MLDQKLVDTIRQNLLLEMEGRVAACAGESGLVIVPAAQQGLINSPDTHRQIATIIYREYRLRACLCADAFAAMVDECDAWSDDAACEQLREQAIEVLGRSVSDLTRIYNVFRGLPGGTDCMGTLDECYRQAVAEVDVRISVALEGLASRR